MHTDSQLHDMSIVLRGYEGYQELLLWQERHVSQLKELQQHLEEEKNTALAREQGNTKAVMEELAHSKKVRTVGYM